MKPLKETKLGQWLKDKAPKIGNIIGDVLPDKGVLGIVKNLISSEDVSPEVRAEFLRLEYEFEKELMELEIEDRKSARSRESEFVKATGHMDYFMSIFGGVILALFCYTVWVSSTGSIPLDMREIFIESRAAVRDIILAIAAYYWGSSAGSRIKDMKPQK